MYVCVFVLCVLTPKLLFTRPAPTAGAERGNLEQGSAGRRLAQRAKKRFFLLGGGVTRNT